MTNPFTPAGATTFPNGPGQVTDNLTGLAAGQAKALGVVGNIGTVYADDYVGPIQIETGATATPAGFVQALIITSEDNVTWTDGISPTANTDQASKINAAPTAPGGIVNTPSASTAYVLPEFSISSALGFMPSNWSIVIKNGNTIALNGTAANFSAKHNLISFA